MHIRQKYECENVVEISEASSNSHAPQKALNVIYHHRRVSLFYESRGYKIVTLILVGVTGKIPFISS
jgi:hypothetical protein